MGIFDRIILTLYTFSLTFISLAFILMALGWLAPLDVVRASLSDPDGRWVVGIVAATFFVVSLRLLYFGFRRRYPGQTLVHQTPLGEVRISLDAVENLVRKVVRQVTGVRDVRARVLHQGGEVGVSLRVTVSPDLSVPEVSDKIQNAVKNYVRNVVGVGVHEVEIFVENIGDEVRRGRVE
ncbi:MAG: alkaline shock response membrane anchor protein AmaP [Acetobacteraceae bacterium]|nr:alkaline shock response membrane anchor protein AmaP [Acetobacteraceae bacterium]